jgi:hypothetical protein
MHAQIISREHRRTTMFRVRDRECDLTHILECARKRIEFLFS